MPLTLSDASRLRPVDGAIDPTLPQWTQDTAIGGASEFEKSWTSTGLGGRANALWTQAAKAGNQDVAARMALEAQAAGIDQDAAQWAPRVQNMTDVRSLRDAADWLGGSLGNLRTSVAPAVGGLAGAAVGAIAAPFTGGVINPVNAGFAGGAAAGYDMETDEAVAAAMRDPYIRANHSYEDILAAGRVKGGINSLLEAAVPTVMGGKVAGTMGKGAVKRFFGQALSEGEQAAARAAERVAQRAIVDGGKLGAAKAVGKNVLEGGAGEFGTETSQSLTGQATQNYLQDKDVGDLGNYDFKQALNEGAAGAVAGGGMGIVGGVGDVGHAYAGVGKDKATEIKKDPAGAAADFIADAGTKVGKGAAKVLDVMERMGSPEKRAYDTLVGARGSDEQQQAAAMQWAQHALDARDSSEEDRAAAADFVQQMAAGNDNAWADYRDTLTINHHEAKQASGDAAIADEIATRLGEKSKASKMSGSMRMTIESGALAPDFSQKQLETTADIWRKQGVSEKLLTATSDKTDAKQREMSIGLLGWVARGFTDVDGNTFIPESLVKRYGENTPKIIQSAAKLAFQQGLIDHDVAKQVPEIMQEATKQYAEETGVHDAILNAIPDYARDMYSRDDIADLDQVLRHVARHGTNESQEKGLLKVFGSKEAIAQAMSKLPEEKSIYGNKVNKGDVEQGEGEVRVAEDEQPVKYHGYNRTTKPFNTLHEGQKNALATRLSAHSNEYDSHARSIGAHDALLEQFGQEHEYLRRAEDEMLWNVVSKKDSSEGEKAAYLAHIDSLSSDERRGLLKALNKNFKFIRDERVGGNTVSDRIEPEAVNSFRETRKPGAQTVTPNSGVIYLERKAKVDKDSGEVRGKDEDFLTTTYKLIGHVQDAEGKEKEGRTRGSAGKGVKGSYESMLRGLAALISADDSFTGRIGFKENPTDAAPTYMAPDSEVVEGRLSPYSYSRLPLGLRLSKTTTVADAEKQARTELKSGAPMGFELAEVTSVKQMRSELQRLANYKQVSYPLKLEAEAALRNDNDAVEVLYDRLNDEWNSEPSEPGDEIMEATDKNVTPTEHAGEAAMYRDDDGMRQGLGVDASGYEGGRSSNKAATPVRGRTVGSQPYGVLTAEQKVENEKRRKAGKPLIYPEGRGSKLAGVEHSAEAEEPATAPLATVKNPEKSLAPTKNQIDVLDKVESAKNWAVEKLRAGMPAFNKAVAGFTKDRVETLINALKTFTVLGPEGVKKQFGKTLSDSQASALLIRAATALRQLEGKIEALSDEGVVNDTEERSKLGERERGQAATERKSGGEAGDAQVDKVRKPTVPIVGQTERTGSIGLGGILSVKQLDDAIYKEDFGKFDTVEKLQQLATHTYQRSVELEQRDGLTEREEGIGAIAGQLVFEAQSFIKNPNRSGPDFEMFFDGLEYTDADVKKFVAALAGRQSKQSRIAASEARTIFAPQWHEGFAGALDKLRAAFARGGRSAQEAGNTPLAIGRTPVVLRSVMEDNGSKPFKRSEYLLGQGSTVYLKGINEHGSSLHSDVVGYDVLRKLPALLANPVAVFKSSGEAQDTRSFKVLLDARSATGAPVVVGLKPDVAMQQIGGAQVHLVATVFPTTWQRVRAWNESGALRYYDERSPLARVAGNNRRESGTGEVHTREGFSPNITNAPAGVKVMSAGELEALPQSAWSTQTANDGTGKRTTKEEKTAAKKEILDTIGDTVKGAFVKHFGDNSSGSWTPGENENVIRLALNGDVLSTAYHESLHEFFDMLKKYGNEATVRLLERVASNEVLNRKIEKLLAKHPEAAAQVRESPEEAAAFLYQFWRAGQIQLGQEITTGLFNKIKQFFAQLLGKVSQTVRDEQHAEAILQAFARGDFKSMNGDTAVREASMAALNASTEQHERALDNLDKAGREITRIAGRVFFSAEAMLKGTKNKHMAAVADLYNVESGQAKGKEQSLFDGIKQQDGIWMNKLDNLLNAYKPEDLELAREALSKGVPAQDRIAKEIVAKIEAFNKEMFNYISSRDVRRWDDEAGKWVKVEHRKNYFTRVWNTNEIQNRTTEFRDRLLQRHAKELAATAKLANQEMQDYLKGSGDYANLGPAARASIDKSIASFNASGKIMDKLSPGAITPEMVADAIVHRLLNSKGHVDLAETTSSLGLSPVATSVNRRSLSWIDDKLFDDFKSKDIGAIMSSYVMTMVKRAEYTRVMGHGSENVKTLTDKAVLHELGGDALVTKAEASLGLAVKRWAKAKVAAKKAGVEFDEPFPTLRAVGQRLHNATLTEEQAREQLIKALKSLDQGFKAVMAMDGTLGATISQGQRAVNGLVMRYQTVRLLPLVVFSSVNDIMGIVANGGELHDAWDALVAGMKEIRLRWSDKKTTDNRAVRAEGWGTVDAGSFLDNLGQTYGSMYMNEKARKFSNAFFKWNGMEGWNRAMRITATAVAERALKAYRKEGFDQNDKAAVSRFEHLFGKGFKASDIKLDADGELDMNDSMNQAAMMRWVSNAIMTPNAAHRTIWGSDARMAPFWMLKQFAYTFHRVMLKTTIEQAKLGNFRPMMVLLLGYAPVTIAADAVKEMLIPGDEPPWMKGGLDGYLAHAFDRSGVFGVPGLSYDALTAYDGPVLGSISALGGPTVGQLTSVPFDSVGKTALGAAPFGSLLRRAAD